MSRSATPATVPAARGRTRLRSGVEHPSAGRWGRAGLGAGGSRNVQHGNHELFMAIETSTQVHSGPQADGVDPSAVTEKKKNDQSYWSLVRRQYKKNSLAMMGLYFIGFMFFIAIFADFLANDKPIVCKYKGEVLVPVVRDYLVGLGVGSYSRDLANADWKALNYDWKVFPPIPYTGNGTDILASAVKPFESGSDHYLGTDQLGHDVLAGLIHGSRISRIFDGSGMSVGLWTGTTSPPSSSTSTSTLGIVVISSRSYSRSSRSRTMSMWRRPRKPQRKPNPSASEVSGSHDSAASLSVSFSSASRRSG